MSFDSLLCRPFLEDRSERFVLPKTSVTFLGGSGNVSGTLRGLGYLGGYLTSAGTISLLGIAAL